MRNDNFFVIQGWMVNELGLSGNELMVYAIIYGFSQDQNSWFEGSLTYLNSFINCKSKTTTLTILKNLVEKGLIEKQDCEINNIKFCKYRTVYQKLIYPISEIDTNNNIINNKKENSIINNTTKEKKFVKPTIKEIQEYCYERGNNVDAHSFYDFYESKGWMIGKNKMKDWKSAVRTWERNRNPIKKELKTNIVPEWYNKEIESSEEIDDDDFQNFLKEFRNE